MKGRTSGKNLGQNIVEILRSNEIAMADCREQAYDGAAAMSSDRCGSEAEVRKEAPNAAYTHCRSHVINLAIVAACKNRSISNMMDVRDGASKTTCKKVTKKKPRHLSSLPYD